MELKVPFSPAAYMDKKLMSHFMDETEEFLLFEKSNIVVDGNKFLLISMENGNG